MSLVKDTVRLLPSVYKISADEHFYFGSTRGSLARRIEQHKYLATRKPEWRVYRLINTVGWDKVSIEEVQSFPANVSEEELRSAENALIVQFLGDDKLLNSKRARIPEEERPQLQREASSRWSHAHRSEATAAHRDYVEAHREEVAAYNKAYQERNKDHRRELAQKRAASITDERREHIKQQAAVHREGNREKLRLYAAVMLTCECGYVIRRSNLSTHRKKPEHATVMAALQQAVPVIAEPVVCA